MRWKSEVCSLWKWVMFTIILIHSKNENVRILCPGIEREAMGDGHLLQFYIFIVCLTHTHKNYYSKKKYKWYKYAVYLKCLCGLGPISIWMPLEAMWNPGVKQVRISKERKDVDILSRVCSIWKYLELGKYGILET